MISITEAAECKMHQINKQQIRVMIINGGCAGLMYQLQFDNEAQESDQVFQFNVRVVIKKNDLKIMGSIVIDYQKSLISERFVVISKENECPCGISFKLKNK